MFFLLIFLLQEWFVLQKLTFVISQNITTIKKILSLVVKADTVCFEKYNIILSEKVLL